MSMKRNSWVGLSTLFALVLSAGELFADPSRLDPRVLASFREVVAQPAKSTVQIYCDGFRSALGTVVREDGYVATKSSELKGKIECLLHGRRQNEATTLSPAILLST
jgi:hypothetical protein